MFAWLRQAWRKLWGNKSAAAVSRDAREGRYEAEQDIARYGAGYWRR